MATDIKALGDQIVGLTLLEAKALADYLKETHGIEAAAGGADPRRNRSGQEDGYPQGSSRYHGSRPR